MFDVCETLVLALSLSDERILENLFSPVVRSSVSLLCSDFSVTIFFFHASMLRNRVSDF